MKKFLFVVLSVALAAPTLAVAQGVAADRLHCAAGEIQVCTKPSDGGFLVMLDERARPLYDCSVATDRGVDLRCVAESDVCTAAHAACDQLEGDYRWSERRCRCYQHVDPTPPPPSPDPDRLTVVVFVCGARDFAELDAEMDRIERDLQVAELHPLQLRATAVYSRLLECDDGSERATALINRAAQLIANFEAEPLSIPDYSDDLTMIRVAIEDLDSRPIVVRVEPEENWCTDTHAGRFVCIALPIIAGLAAIAGGVVLYDYLDDGSADGIIHW